MKCSRLTTALIVLTAFILAWATPAGITADKKNQESDKKQKKSKHAPKNLPSKPNPKPRPNPGQAHNPVPTHAHSRAHQVHHDFYAGKAARSRSWYQHHHHRSWVYEVRYRSRRWHERIFASHWAAHTFMVHLRHHHFERHLHHPAEGVWLVTYRSPHGHHFGTYASLPVARHVETALRASGFSAWLHWHRRYF